MPLDYIALGLLFFVTIFVFYAVIVIHDIPYEIAVHRNHPHQDAIHVAGWVSLFTLHVLWPFLWIWSTLYREDRGWGFSSTQASLDNNQLQKDAAISTLKNEISALKQEVESIKESMKEKGGV